MERIPLEGWQTYTGHTDRYAWAAQLTSPLEQVNDIACGIGYGAAFFAYASAVYTGYDRPGVPAAGQFPGTFLEADLDDPDWRPMPADVTVCFETLEHVKDPARLAEVICETTARCIFVSVPVVATTHINGHHLHNFTEADIPPLFPGFVIGTEWPQPEEFSHVWQFVRQH